MKNRNLYGMPLELVEQSTFKSSAPNEDIHIWAWIIAIGETDPVLLPSERSSYRLDHGLALTNCPDLKPRQQSLPQECWGLLARFAIRSNLRIRDIQKINFLPDASIDRDQLNQWVKDLNIEKQCQDFLDKLKAEKKLKEEDDEFWGKYKGF